MTTTEADATLLDRIARLRANMGRGERRIADYVLDHPEPVTRATLAELAAGAGVSEPTVLRFVRAFGCTGVPEFRVRVGQSLVRSVPYLHREVSFEDDPATVVDKVFASSLVAIQATQAALDREAFARAVSTLRTARRIDCYGVGAASALAVDAQQKFMRLGVPTVSYADGHLQIAAAATLASGDVALCFSYTGAIRDSVTSAREARQSGATVIALTRPGTPLAAEASLLLAVDAPENTEVYAPMSSRLSHAVVLDALATAVALAFGEPVLERLRRVKDAGAGLRLPTSPRRLGRTV